MGEREPAQHKTVDNGELRGRRTNSESEYEHGENTKRFLLEQDTETNTHILKKRFYKHRLY